MKPYLWIVCATVAAGAYQRVDADEPMLPPPSAAGTALQRRAKPSDLPPPEPIHGATVVASSEVCPGACAGRECRGSCWQRLKEWACFHPCKLAHCGEYDRLAPPTPALYLYFLHPPCIEGCGLACARQGCTAIDQGSGHGLGPISGPGTAK